MSGHSKQLNKQVLWISAQTEQYKSCGAYTSDSLQKPSIWTAYCRGALTGYVLVLIVLTMLTLLTTNKTNIAHPWAPE